MFHRKGFRYHHPKRNQEPPFFLTWWQRLSGEHYELSILRNDLWNNFSHEAESNEGHGGGDEEATHLQRAWLWHLA